MEGEETKVIPIQKTVTAAESGPDMVPVLSVNFSIATLVLRNELDAARVLADRKGCYFSSLFFRFLSFFFLLRIFGLRLVYDKLNKKL